MDTKEKYLPIGSIVMLKGASKSLMIIGYAAKDTRPEAENKIYDYIGAVFPEGILDFSQIPMFNHDQIDKIIYMGLENEEQKKFVEELKVHIDNGE